MSSEDKVYVVVAGIVQAFMKEGVKQPAVKQGNANGNVVYNVTIQTQKGGYVDIALWAADFGDAPAKITEGTVLWVKGALTRTPKNNGGFWNKVNAFTCTASLPMTKLPREIVNQQPAAPVAAEAAPAEAVAAAPAADYDF